MYIVVDKHFTYLLTTTYTHLCAENYVKWSDKILYEKLQSKIR